MWERKYASMTKHLIGTVLRMGKQTTNFMNTSRPFTVNHRTRAGFFPWEQDYKSGSHWERVPSLTTVTSYCTGFDIYIDINEIAEENCQVTWAMSKRENEYFVFILYFVLNNLLNNGGVTFSCLCWRLCPLGGYPAPPWCFFFSQHHLILLLVYLPVILPLKDWVQCFWALTPDVLELLFPHGYHHLSPSHLLQNGLVCSVIGPTTLAACWAQFDYPYSSTDHTSTFESFSSVLSEPSPSTSFVLLGLILLLRDKPWFLASPLSSLLTPIYAWMLWLVPRWLHSTISSCWWWGGGD